MTETDRQLLDEAFEVARDYVGPEGQPLKLAKLTERIAEVARRHADRVARHGEGTNDDRL